MPRALQSTKYQSLRRNLIEARLASGMTQGELAKKLHRPQSFVSKYEIGDRHLDVIEFLQVCSHLQVSPAMILDAIS